MEELQCRLLGFGGTSTFEHLLPSYSSRSTQHGRGSLSALPSWGAASASGAAFEQNNQRAYNYSSVNNGIDWLPPAAAAALHPAEAAMISDALPLSSYYALFTEFCRCVSLGKRQYSVEARNVLGIIGETNPLASTTLAKQQQQQQKGTSQKGLPIATSVNGRDVVAALSGVVDLSGFECCVPHDESTAHHRAKSQAGRSIKSNTTKKGSSGFAATSSFVDANPDDDNSEQQEDDQEQQQRITDHDDFVSLVKQLTEDTTVDIPRASPSSTSTNTNNTNNNAYRANVSDLAEIGYYHTALASVLQDYVLADYYSFVKQIRTASDVDIIRRRFLPTFQLLLPLVFTVRCVLRTAAVGESSSAAAAVKKENISAAAAAAAARKTSFSSSASAIASYQRGGGGGTTESSSSLRSGSTPPATTTMNSTSGGGGAFAAATQQQQYRHYYTLSPPTTSELLEGIYAFVRSQDPSVEYRAALHTKVYMSVLLHIAHFVAHGELLEHQHDQSYLTNTKNNTVGHSDSEGLGSSGGGFGGRFIGGGTPVGQHSSYLFASLTQRKDFFIQPSSYGAGVGAGGIPSSGGVLGAMTPALVVHADKLPFGISIASAAAILAAAKDRAVLLAELELSVADATTASIAAAGMGLGGVGVGLGLAGGEGGSATVSRCSRQQFNVIVPAGLLQAAADKRNQLLMLARRRMYRQTNSKGTAGKREEREEGEGAVKKALLLLGEGTPRVGGGGEAVVSNRPSSAPPLPPPPFVEFTSDRALPHGLAARAIFTSLHDETLCKRPLPSFSNTTGGDTAFYGSNSFLSEGHLRSGGSNTDSDHNTFKNGSGDAVLASPAAFFRSSSALGRELSMKSESQQGRTPLPLSSVFSSSSSLGGGGAFATACSSQCVFDSNELDSRVESARLTWSRALWSIVGSGSVGDASAVAKQRCAQLLFAPFITGGTAVPISSLGSSERSGKTVGSSSAASVLSLGTAKAHDDADGAPLDSRGFIIVPPTPIAVPLHTFYAAAFNEAEEAAEASSLQKKRGTATTRYYDGLVEEPPSSPSSLPFSGRVDASRRHRDGPKYNDKDDDETNTNERTSLGNSSGLKNDLRYPYANVSSSLPSKGAAQVLTPEALQALDTMGIQHPGIPSFSSSPATVMVLGRREAEGPPSMASAATAAPQSQRRQLQDADNDDCKGSNDADDGDDADDDEMRSRAASSEATAAAPAAAGMDMSTKGAVAAEEKDNEKAEETSLSSIPMPTAGKKSSIGFSTNPILSPSQSLSVAAKEGAQARSSSNMRTTAMDIGDAATATSLSTADAAAAAIRRAKSAVGGASGLLPSPYEERSTAPSVVSHSVIGGAEGVAGVRRVAAGAQSAVGVRSSAAGGAGVGLQGMPSLASAAAALANLTAAPVGRRTTTVITGAIATSMGGGRHQQQDQQQQTSSYTEEELRAVQQQRFVLYLYRPLSLASYVPKLSFGTLFYHLGLLRDMYLCNRGPFWSVFVEMSFDAVCYNPNAANSNAKAGGLLGDGGLSFPSLSSSVGSGGRGARSSASSGGGAASFDVHRTVLDAFRQATEMCSTNSLPSRLWTMAGPYHAYFAAVHHHAEATRKGRRYVLCGAADDDDNNSEDDDDADWRRDRNRNRHRGGRQDDEDDDNPSLSTPRANSEGMGGRRSSRARQLTAEEEALYDEIGDSVSVAAAGRGRRSASLPTTAARNNTYIFGVGGVGSTGGQKRARHTYETVAYPHAPAATDGNMSSTAGKQKHYTLPRGVLNSHYGGKDRSPSDKEGQQVNPLFISQLEHDASYRSWFSATPADEMDFLDDCFSISIDPPPPTHSQSLSRPSMKTGPSPPTGSSANSADLSGIGDEPAALEAIRRIGRISLRYHPPCGSAHLVVTPNAMYEYQRIFRFYLQIKYARRSLVDVRSVMGQFSASSFAATPTVGGIGVGSGGKGKGATRTAPVLHTSGGAAAINKLRQQALAAGGFAGRGGASANQNSDEFGLLFSSSSMSLPPVEVSPSVLGPITGVFTTIHHILDHLNSFLMLEVQETNFSSFLNRFFAPMETVKKAAGKFTRKKRGGGGGAAENVSGGGARSVFIGGVDSSSCDEGDSEDADDAVSSFTAARYRFDASVSKVGKQRLPYESVSLARRERNRQRMGGGNAAQISDAVGDDRNVFSSARGNSRPERYETMSAINFNTSNNKSHMNQNHQHQRRSLRASAEAIERILNGDVAASSHSEKPKSATPIETVEAARQAHTLFINAVSEGSFLSTAGAAAASSSSSASRSSDDVANAIAELLCLSHMLRNLIHSTRLFTATVVRGGGGGGGANSGASQTSSPRPPLSLFQQQQQQTNQSQQQPSPHSSSMPQQRAYTYIQLTLSRDAVSSLEYISSKLKRIVVPSLVANLSMAASYQNNDGIFGGSSVNGVAWWGDSSGGSLSSSSGGAGARALWTRLDFNRWMSMGPRRGGGAAAERNDNIARGGVGGMGGASAASATHPSTVVRMNDGDITNKKSNGGGLSPPPSSHSPTVYGNGTGYTGGGVRAQQLRTASQEEAFENAGTHGGRDEEEADDDDTIKNHPLAGFKAKPLSSASMMGHQPSIVPAASSKAISPTRPTTTAAAATAADGTNSSSSASIGHSGFTVSIVPNPNYSSTRHNTPENDKSIAGGGVGVGVVGGGGYSPPQKSRPPHNSHHVDGDDDDAAAPATLLLANVTGRAEGTSQKFQRPPVLPPHVRLAEDTINAALNVVVPLPPTSTREDIETSRGGVSSDRSISSLSPSRTINGDKERRRGKVEGGLSFSSPPPSSSSRLSATEHLSASQTKKKKADSNPTTTTTAPATTSKGSFVPHPQRSPPPPPSSSSSTVTTTSTSTAFLSQAQEAVVEAGGLEDTYPNQAPMLAAIRARLAQLNSGIAAAERMFDGKSVVSGTTTPTTRRRLLGDVDGEEAEGDEGEEHEEDHEQAAATAEAVERERRRAVLMMGSSSARVKQTLALSTVVAEGVAAAAQQQQQQQQQVTRQQRQQRLLPPPTLEEEAEEKENPKEFRGGTRKERGEVSTNDNDNDNDKKDEKEDGGIGNQRDMSEESRHRSLKARFGGFGRGLGVGSSSGLPASASGPLSLMMPSGGGGRSSSSSPLPSLRQPLDEDERTFFMRAAARDKGGRKGGGGEEGYAEQKEESEGDKASGNNTFYTSTGGSTTTRRITKSAAVVMPLTDDTNYAMHGEEDNNYTNNYTTKKTLSPTYHRDPTVVSVGTRLTPPPTTTATTTPTTTTRTNTSSKKEGPTTRELLDAIREKRAAAAAAKTAHPTEMGDAQHFLQQQQQQQHQLYRGHDHTDEEKSDDLDDRPFAHGLGANDEDVDEDRDSYFDQYDEAANDVEEEEVGEDEDETDPTYGVGIPRRALLHGEQNTRRRETEDSVRHFGGFVGGEAFYSQFYRNDDDDGREEEGVRRARAAHRHHHDDHYPPQQREERGARGNNANNNTYNGVRGGGGGGGGGSPMVLQHMVFDMRQPSATTTAIPKAPSSRRRAMGDDEEKVDHGGDDEEDRDSFFDDVDGEDEDPSEYDWEGSENEAEEEDAEKH